jgi:copper chaperone CopZ
MYCQKCLNNVIKAVSKIEKVEFLDIDMVSKCIKLKYRDSVLDNNGIRLLINQAITTGRV